MDTESLEREILGLREQLESAEQTLRAMTSAVSSDIDQDTRPSLHATTLRSQSSALADRLQRGALTVTPSGAIVYANRRFAEMAGTPLAHLLSATLVRCVVPSDAARVERFLATASVDAAIDVQLRLPEGEPLYVRLSVVSVNTDRIALLAADLTIRERVEEVEHTLRAILEGDIDGVVVGGEHVILVDEARHSYRAIVDGMPNGAATVSPHGDVLYANERFATMLGVPRERLLGRSLYALVGGPLQALHEMMQTDRHAEARCEITIVRGDGLRVPVGVTAASSNGGDEVTLLFTDLTEQQRQAELEEQARKKDEFLAVLGHELRNPLAPIANAVQVLERLPGLGDAGRRCVDVIGRQVRTLARLVDDLLDVHRLSEGKIVLRRSVTDLRDVLDNAIEAAGPYIAAKSHNLDVKAPERPVFVDGDAVRLTQAVLNIVANAAKYTPRGGNICVVLDGDERAATQGLARVRVIDNGIGIAPEVLGKIFEPYVQVQGTEDNTGGGLGLGLAVARKLIELHGGSVRAESAGQGQGSTFVIELPICEQPDIEPPAVPSSPLEPRRLRVLVADDNRDNAQSLAMLLQLLGHEVRVASDGREALDVADDWRPDIAFVDLGMPRLDGYEAARALRERPWTSKLALYALTGWGQADVGERATAAGFNGHFTKPIELEALQRAVRQHADRAY